MAGTSRRWKKALIDSLLPFTYVLQCTRGIHGAVYYGVGYETETKEAKTVEVQAASLPMMELRSPGDAQGGSPKERLPGSVSRVAGAHGPLYGSISSPPPCLLLRHSSTSGYLVKHDPGR